MWCRVCSVIIIIIAVVIAVLACTSYADQYQNWLLTAGKFFDIVWPILGVGALLKYLLSGGGCHCCKKSECHTSDDSDKDR
ncbi:MAG: hypothetical protein ACK4PR_04675 [Gammaproteobacteria bacterium]